MGEAMSSVPSSRMADSWVASQRAALTEIEFLTGSETRPEPWPSQR